MGGFGWRSLGPLQLASSGPAGLDGSTGVEGLLDMGVEEIVGSLDTVVEGIVGVIVALLELDGRMDESLSA